MILRYSLAITASLLAATPFIHCLSPSDIPPDTPISSLVASANTNLAQGKYNDALTYFDIALSRDPQNYLTLFKRGATYLSLGKNALASMDFDKVLTIKPDFEGALLQRARIKSKNGDWDAAKHDYVAAGKGENQEVLDLQEAQGAASLAAEAASKQDWEGCISQSGVAIMVAGTSLGLRQLRASCRFERGEIREGVNDLTHVLQMSPGSIRPHLQMSAMLFYSLGDIERGLAQMRKCLHSDPDSKPCSKMFRREKVTNKALAKVRELMDKRQMNSAVKLLVPTGEDAGLIQDLREEVKELREDGIIHSNAPNDLLGMVLEMTCEAYTEVCFNTSRELVHLLIGLDEKPQES
jgi:DnaJ family protein C protein 3